MKNPQKGPISANQTHTTTRANIFDLKSPEERPKSTSHVVSGQKNQEREEKALNVDILGSLKKYL